MPDADFSFLAAALSRWLPLATPPGLLAYLGPGPALDFIPYFLALLAWLGAAFGAMLLWPLSALLRRFRRSKPRSGVEERNELLAENAPEAADDVHHDQP